MKKDLLLTIGGFIAGVGATIGLGVYSKKTQDSEEFSAEESE